MLEKLAKKIFDECQKDGEPVTMEEAREMAEMEIKAGNVKRYEKSDAPRKKTTKERKIDPDKANLFSLLMAAAANFPDCSDLTPKNEAEINFTYNDYAYTIKLIKHRKGKG